MQVHTKFNRPSTRYRSFNKPSKTQPDQTMSLKVIVTKYVRGLPINAPHREGVFTDDVPAEDFNKLDYAEQEERLFEASAELSSLKSNLAKQREEEALKSKEKAEKQEKELADLRAKVENLTGAKN